MARLVDELKELTSAFSDNGIDYALCGGLAMATHGFVRATLDIDLLIREESLERAYEIGNENGFDRESREKIDFLGKQLSVVSRQGLIKMKQLAGRPQDLVDIERLENEES